jgi:hypothetical protein
MDWRFLKIEILVDYLRFTTKIHNAVGIKELLGILDVEYVVGNARDGWANHDYCNGMHVYYGGRDDIGVELSGSGAECLKRVTAVISIG